MKKNPSQNVFVNEFTQTPKGKKVEYYVKTSRGGKKEQLHCTSFGETTIIVFLGKSNNNNKNLTVNTIKKNKCKIPFNISKSNPELCKNNKIRCC